MMTLITMGNLANVVWQQGNLSEAESLLRRTIEIMAETLGADHPQTLAELLNIRGRHTEAEALSRATWEAQKRVMGETHHCTLESYDELGVSLRHLGQLEQAEAIHRQVWQAKIEVLGPQNNLAAVLLALEKTAEAESIYREILTVRTELLGPNYRDTLKSMAGLIETLQAAGKTIETDQLQRLLDEAQSD
jgi:Flp pilus assembly protein TadD